MGRICVNRSGRSWSVTETNAGGAVIGTIEPNEVFTWVAAWPGNEAGQSDEQRIYFRNSSGVLKYGWINNASAYNTFTSLSNFGKFNANLNNKNCAVFRTRRTVKVYDTAGNPYRVRNPINSSEYLINGSLSANSYVATSDATCGATHPGWMYVECFGPNDPSFGPGFVDIGLNVSSSPSGISLEGSL